MPSWQARGAGNSTGAGTARCMSARCRRLGRSASGGAEGGWQSWYVKPVKRGEYHTVYVANGNRVTFYTQVK
jgi:hypothetical protein